MSSEKPNFLAQPVVKNVFMYRNGDPYYEARRIVINQKRVCNFETLLREVTGGIQAPFGAVRNIYTPRGGHKVDCLESLQSGEQYVAAGRERFKKLDYLQIGNRRKRMMQTLPVQAKPLPQNRIIASARFLKPIKEPCTIFVVANGDVLDPAMRLLIHQRVLGQFEKILEMVTEKMGLKVLGGVRSLYTYEGQQVTDGNQLESGQLYVAVGREKFKKLPYSDLLFTKPRGTRRVKGMKAYSLPPIYRLSKQSGNSKSMVRCSDSGDAESKASPPSQNGNNNKEHLSSIVREISQARLLSLRKRRSGQSLTHGTSDNDDLESKADDGNADGKPPQDQAAEEKHDTDDAKAKEEDGEKAEEKENITGEASENGDKVEDKENTTEEGAENDNRVEEKENTTEEDAGNGEKEEEKENTTEEDADNGEKAEEKENTTEEDAENGEKAEEKENTTEEDAENGEKAEEKENTTEEDASIEDKKDDQETNGEKEEGEEKQDGGENEEKGLKEEVKEEVKSEEQELTSDNSQEQDKNTEEKQDKDSGEEEKSTEDHAKDADKGEEQKEAEKSNDPDKSQSDNHTKESDNGASSNGNQEEDVSKTKEGDTKESGEEDRKVNGEVSGEDDEVESEAEMDLEDKKSASHKDATANEEKGKDNDKQD